MKKLFTLPLVILFTIGLFSQVPEKMSYQAVIRDDAGTLVKSHSVGIQISILQSSISGTVVFAETHTATTNADGLVTLEIGSGTPVAGTFAGIDWSTGIYFIKTETDPSGGTTYSIEGISQILSVPYAFYAKTSGSSPELESLIKFVYSQFPPPTSGLVGYWSFTGNANDESGNGYNGTVNGAILTTDRFGNENTAYSFDGINDYIAIAPSSLVDNETAATLSFWLKRGIDDDYGLPIHTGNQGYLNTQVKKDSVLVAVCTNSDFDGSAPTEFGVKWTYIQQTQWNHIILRYDGGTAKILRLYINGVLKKEVFAEGNIWSPQSAYLAFGVYYLFGTPNSGYYKGILDDVRLYKRALNDAEIQTLYHEGGW